MIICFQMITILLGMQAGYTKYPCVLCLWDSRADDRHFNKCEWPLREHMNIGQHNAMMEPLVQRYNMLLPPLHIKLGLMKNYIKALVKEGGAFQFLRSKFKYISEAKINAGILNGPQIRELISNSNFDESMTNDEIQAWISLKSVIQNFLGNNRGPEYEEIVDVLMNNFRILGSRMSIKMNFLNSHLDYFPSNCGDYSEEQGERVHQDISTMEEIYQGRMDVNMCADYCCSLMRDKPSHEYNRKAIKKPFINV